MRETDGPIPEAETAVDPTGGAVDLHEVSEQSEVEEVDEDTPEKPRKPSEVRLSWFAGFFDGEGNVQIARNVRRGTYANYQPRISVTNTNLYVLQCIQLTYGGSVTKHSTSFGRSRGWRPSWRWTLTGEAAWKLVIRILPYTRVKTPALKLLRRFCAYKNQRHPSLITLYRYKQRMTKLNRRGLP